MGMKLKSGADLCGFQLRNFCVQGEASAPSDAALGRKYFHTNATDDVATGISLLHRERIYLGEGVWRATAYLDDIANLQGKIDALDELLNGEDSQTYVDTWEEVKAFLEGVTESKDLMDLLNAKADKTQLANYLPLSGGTITGRLQVGADNNTASLEIATVRRGHFASFRNTVNEMVLTFGETAAEKILAMGDSGLRYSPDGTNYNNIIHSGNIGSYNAGGASKLLNIGSPADANAVTYTDTALRWISMIPATTSNIPITTGYQNGLLALPLHENGITAQLYFSYNKNPWFRSSQSGQWKEFAFTDSNVAWSQGLKHSNGTIGAVVNSSGNVLIGATTDDNSGAKLQVNGSISSYYSGSGARHVYVGNTNGMVSLYVAASGNRGLFDASNSKWMVYTDGTDIIMPRDVHIKGNLIVDGEVSAGGAGAEGDTSGGGGAEGVSEIFTPTSTSMAFDHNLGEDVIVQVYEKSGNVWNMVIVDTEITSATRVTLRFGKTETTQHKVVIMGV